MKRIICIYAVLALLAPLTLRGQSEFYDYEYSIAGQSLSRYAVIGMEEMATYGIYNSGFGTARSAAMGGAFTSLGGDLSSMSINPAGLGMYRSSEIGVTPVISFGRMDTKYGQMGSSDGGNRSRFTINNFGAALNVHQGYGTLTGATIGFSYNKLADFNYRSTVTLPAGNVSIMNIFARQLNWDGGINPELLQGESPWESDNIYFEEWGSVLAYKTGMIRPTDSAYEIFGIGNNTAITPTAHTISRGSIGEYNLSGGFNILNTLYLGFSFAFLDIYNQQDLIYEESYSGDFGGLPTHEQAHRMKYTQYSKVNGTGFNFKFGAVYRPIDELRIGLAVHTPTYISLNTTYRATMGTYYGNGRSNIASSWYLDSDYDFQTPTRLLAGISYTFLDRAILSFDYERQWFNKMRVRNAESDIEHKYRNLFERDFKGNNTFRVGVEYRVTDIVSARAGFAWMDSFLRDRTINGESVKGENVAYNTPMPYQYYNISGGLGFRLGRTWTLDLAYVYMDTKYTKYDLFYYEGYDAQENIQTVITHDDVISPKRNYHNIMATIGYRF